jgi:hypothetical protein
MRSDRALSSAPINSLPLPIPYLLLGGLGDSDPTLITHLHQVLFLFLLILTYLLLGRLGDSDPTLIIRLHQVLFFFLLLPLFSVKVLHKGLPKAREKSMARQRTRCNLILVMTVQRENGIEGRRKKKLKRNLRI